MMYACDGVEFEHGHLIQISVGGDKPAAMDTSHCSRYFSLTMGSCTE